MNKPQAPKDIISELLKNKIVEMPFNDFEERMMLSIRREAEVNKQTYKDVKLSSLFFTVGCCLGIAATVIAYTYNWAGGQQQHNTPIFLPVALIVILAMLYYRWPTIKPLLKRM